MFPSAHPAPNAAPVTQFQGRIEPQTRHDQRKESQTQPSSAAVLIVRTLAWVLYEVTLSVRGAMITYTLGTTYARYSVYGRFQAVGSVLARTLWISVFGEQFVAVSTAYLHFDGLLLFRCFERQVGLAGDQFETAFFETRR